MRTTWALLFIITSASAVARDQEWYDQKTCGIELMTTEEANEFRTANGLTAPKTSGVVVKSHVKVWRSEYESVNEGDQIEAVNGVEVKTEEDFQRELEKRKAPGSCKLMVLRRAGKKYALVARPVSLSVRTNREIAKEHVEIAEDKTTGEQIARWNDLRSFRKSDALITFTFRIDKAGQASRPILSVLYVGEKFLRLEELVVRDGDKVDRFSLKDPSRRYDDGFAIESSSMEIDGEGLRLLDRLTEGRSKETVIRFSGELRDCDAVPVELSKMRDAFEAYGGIFPKRE